MCSENNGIGVAVYQILMCVTLSHMSINRMVKTAGFRVLKTLDEFVWNSAIELPSGLTQEYMTDLHFLTPKENLIFMGTVGTGKTHLLYRCTRMQPSCCSR